MIYDRDLTPGLTFTVTLSVGDTPTLIETLDFAGWAYEQGYTECVTPAQVDDGSLAIFVKPHADYPAKTVQAWLRDIGYEADIHILRYLDSKGVFHASMLLALSSSTPERQPLDLTDEQRQAWLIQVYEID